MADDNFSIASAQIVSLFTECILYGAYLVTLGYCIRRLASDIDDDGIHVKKDIPWTSLVVPSLLGILGTLDVALELQKTLNVFVGNQAGAQEKLYDMAYWINISKVCAPRLVYILWLTTCQIVIYIAQTFVGDLALVIDCIFSCVFDQSNRLVDIQMLAGLGTQHLDHLSFGDALYSVYGNWHPLDLQADAYSRGCANVP
jgi:hypothetical protein